MLRRKDVDVKVVGTMLASPDLTQVTLVTNSILVMIPKMLGNTKVVHTMLAWPDFDGRHPHRHMHVPPWHLCAISFENYH